MTTLRIEQLALTNFRCFGKLDVAFEPDVTVLFAENGGGKTALLTAVAMALALLQPRQPKELALDAGRDTRRIVGSTGRFEPAGTCTISCVATIGARAGVPWNVTASATSRRRAAALDQASQAIEAVRTPSERWPLVAYYGTGRLSDRKRSRKTVTFHDRWDGYTGALDATPTDGPLLEWLRLEAFGDIVRRRREEPERRFDAAVFDAIKRATPRVTDIWYDPALEGPVIRFEDGHEARWAELSDGYSVFMGLVGDIARRAVILNGQDGAEAPLLVEGVVLVDEIDLHLHPRWQRVVIGGLRAAFPKLQFILTTHSPQVLSSLENRQVRRLVGWAVGEPKMKGEERPCA